MRLMTCSQIILTAQAGLFGLPVHGALPLRQEAWIGAHTDCANMQVQEWWLDLTLLPAARVEPAQRAAHQQQIQAQQLGLKHLLQAHGIAVTASVTGLANALAVRADAQQVQALQRLPGVRAVRPVNHGNRLGAPCGPSRGNMQ
jgi:hypothetical protein